MRILNDQIPQKDAGRQFGAAPALLALAESGETTLTEP